MFSLENITGMQDTNKAGNGLEVLVVKSWWRCTIVLNFYNSFFLFFRTFNESGRKRANGQQQFS
jgi:hypothetical protein